VTPLPGAVAPHGGAARAIDSQPVVPAADSDRLRALDGRRARRLAFVQLQPRAPPRV
jgi:hypothetical protein